MSQLDSKRKLPILQTHVTFMLPFSYESGKKKDVAKLLEQNQYAYFCLRDEKKRGNPSYYGESIVVEETELEQYFYPYIEHKLFPTSIQSKGFHRFSKCQRKEYQFQIRSDLYSFIIHSTDIVLAPFGIGFLSIRLELTDTYEYSDVLDFLQHFRAVESNLDENKGSHIITSENTKQSMHDFIFTCLSPYLKDIVIKNDRLRGYFGSLPYIEDERMFVTTFMITEEGCELTDTDLFRLGSLNGKTPAGEPFIATTNPNYMQHILSTSLHDRWGPNLFIVATDHAFATISNRPVQQLSTELSHYMGTHYYNLLLHYYYKIMLLRVSFEYSEIEWKKDEQYVRSLIKLITLFSSWYYFKVVSTRSEGKELSRLFREAFSIERLYNEVSSTLQELYKSQENSQANRVNTLLFILTIFTVVSGIYGMNLVIADWESPSGWKKFTTYTVFEWISLITALAGIALSGYLIFYTFGRILLQKWRSMRHSLDDE